jgi:hypothetical protein
MLGDIQVYCASEMRKFGIPQAETLRTIMESNFSKLGADGKPIYDDRGKVCKGPLYWKPEPALLQMLLTQQTRSPLTGSPAEAGSAASAKTQTQ